MVLIRGMGVRRRRLDPELAIRYQPDVWGRARKVKRRRDALAGPHDGITRSAFCT